MKRSGAPGRDGTGSPYQTTRWRVLRALVLRGAGYRCQWCGADVRGKGQARVDHIQPARQHPQLFYVISNLRALCVACDNKRHREKGGQGKAKIRPAVGRDGFPVDSDGERWRN